jgi:hypothetical protein
VAFLSALARCTKGGTVTKRVGMNCPATLSDNVSLGSYLGGSR